MRKAKLRLKQKKRKAKKLSEAKFGKIVGYIEEVDGIKFIKPSVYFTHRINFSDGTVIFIRKRRELI